MTIPRKGDGERLSAISAPPVTEKERREAALIVVSYASSRDEAHHLLAMLGLAPEGK